MSDPYFHDGPRGVWARDMIHQQGNNHLPFNKGDHAIWGGHRIRPVARDARFPLLFDRRKPVVQTTRGTPPYTYAIQTGGLPTGLSLDTVTGEVYGIPTVLGQSEIVSFTVIDNNGKKNSSNFVTISIYATLWDVGRFNVPIDIYPPGVWY